jgi:phospholipase/lecithinase/hemolysin
MLKFRRQAASWSAAIATAALLISCGGSENESPATPPLGQTTVVFGGSLSDTGNDCNFAGASYYCPPTPPYAAGRYSNGLLWIETVAAHYGSTATPSSLNGFNYAHAGTTIGSGSPFRMTPPPNMRPPSMLAQVDQYLTRVNFQVNPQDLVVLDSASVINDIADASQRPVPISPDAAVAQAASDLASMINRLYAAGARNIVVVNCFNLGLMPFNASRPPTTPSLAQLTVQFNDELARRIGNIRAGAPGLNLYLVDAFALEAGIVAAPAANGFTNVSDPCYVKEPVPAVCATPDTYYYWDLSNPTYMTGQRLAQETIRVIGRDARM